MMIPIRNAIAAAGAALALTFSAKLDCNPSLFLFDKLYVNEDRLKDYFEGKNIWITGASSGIGKELALRISRYGVKNLILTGRSADRLQSVADICFQQQQQQHSKDFTSSSSPSTISILPLDMSASQDQFEDAIDTLEKILGEDQTLDCVILNAGIGQLRPAISTPQSTTSEVFQVNTLAPILITQMLLQRGMLSPDKGRHIAVTSSIGAMIGVPLSASYAGSKWAIHGYMNSIKAELPWLQINLICPGPVDTSFHSNNNNVDNEKNNESVGMNENDLNNKNKKKLKMSVERCTQLYLSSLLQGTNNKVGGEYWIAEQPTLLGLYINQYFPGIFQTMLSKIGPFRVQAWEEGKDLYDPDTWKNIRKK